MLTRAAEHEQVVLVALEPDGVVAVDGRADNEAVVLGRLVEGGRQSIGVGAETGDDLAGGSQTRSDQVLHLVQLVHHLKPASVVVGRLPASAQVLDRAVVQEKVVVGRAQTLEYLRSGIEEKIRANPRHLDDELARIAVQLDSRPAYVYGNRDKLFTWEGTPIPLDREAQLEDQETQEVTMQVSPGRGGGWGRVKP